MIRSSTLSLEEQEAKRIVKMILPYPLITIIISISLLTFYILSLKSPNGCYTLLAGIFLSIRCLQGTLDAIVFSFNPTVKEEMRKYFKKNDTTNNVILETIIDKNIL